ncbi:HlyD family type I secretion periplasmic adaptor subunit [Halomonas getboli]|uniref:HlyD family type I secretion periplasmic adaptor subunit n=1 Tax=Halomonas getboli TaxID=2935862 RepID=UPI001FFE5EC5|nr:HlyD family type I secretion periplasmic adaptor subunit [Halomonas getboli]MCK2183720.1 HlyD family type I secretion periplasmic adaptor subunit [Halomonas getboli]
MQPTHDAPRPPVDDRRHRLAGLALVLVCVLGFGGWAVSAELAVSVIAPGRVEVASFKKTVQHLEGGIVRRIAVEEGDRVEEGQTLLVLDPTQVESRLQIARSQYLINRAAEVRLMAEQAGEDRLTFPDALDDADSPRNAQLKAVQRGLFHSRREALDGALASLEAQSEQLRQRIEGREAMIRVSREQLASLREDAEAYRSLFKDGLGDNRRLRELEREVLQYQGEIEQHRTEIARLRSQISENDLKKRVRVEEFRQEVGERLRETRRQIADARERMTALRDQRRRTTVTAPAAGTVVGLAVHTRGAVIEPGTTLLEIVPGGGEFVVEARVADQDIDSVYPGQSAEIRFSAFNRRRSRLIDGTVQRVSADSFTDERSGKRYYEVRVRVGEAEREAMPESMRLQAGMPAEVRLQAASRTFASYLAKPVTDMLARAMRAD